MDFVESREKYYEEDSMRRTLCVVMFNLVFFATQSYAISLDELTKGFGSPPRQTPDENTTASGLKEALSIGTGNAVSSVSRVDGYFGNQAIRILMPEKIQKVGASKLG
jgi:hypothetical protein